MSGFVGFDGISIDELLFGMGIYTAFSSPRESVFESSLASLRSLELASYLSLRLIISLYGSISSKS